MGTKNYNSLSSGRWDASGSWADAVLYEKQKAFHWAEGLGQADILQAIISLAEDINADFTTYERQALLYRVVDILSNNV